MNPSTYLIGEIGQNHNGSVELAKQLVDAAAAPVVDKLFDRQLRPMNAVKLTKRDLAHELSEAEMRRPYDSPHSFGKTYGEHRAALELTDEQHFEIFQYAKSKGLDFVETLCAPGTLSLLDLFTPDYLKVASRDLTNLPLLDVMGETRIPLILSTGMAGESELDAAIDVIGRYHQDITILHCLSQYPSDYANINLRSIPYLKTRFPNYRIGYSDHSIGIVVPVAAVVLGASMIEKHITLDRSMKGTDHRGSLEPDGIFRMVRDIRNIEMALGGEFVERHPATDATRVKLARSVASRRELPTGTRIRAEDVHLLSPGDGFAWSERQHVIGKRARCTIPANAVIYPEDIES